MKQLLLLFTLVLTFCASAQADTITISSFSPGMDWRYGGSTAQLRISVSQGFLDSSGTWIPASTSTNFYKTVTCTIASTTITCPAFTLSSTTNGNPNTARYKFQFYGPGTSNTPRDVLWSNFQVPVILGTTISVGQLVAFNQSTANPPRPGFPDIQQVQTLINSATGVVPAARTVTATSPIRIDGGASATLAANVTLSCPTCLTSAGGGVVTSFNLRTGAVVPAQDDYTWAQINKATSSLGDLTTKSAADLTSGKLPLARLGDSGTPDTTTFLRGDNTWAVPQGDVPSSRTLTAGAGLTGGGDLSLDRTFDVGAGNGITVNANDVALNLAYAPTWTANHIWLKASPLLELRNTVDSKRWQLRNGSADLGILDVFDATASKTLIAVLSEEVRIGSATNQGGVGNSSRLYVYGGANGANVDIQGDATQADQATMELESSDYETSFKTFRMQLYGTSGLGTTFGFNNQNLGALAWQNLSTALIYTNNTTPIIFGTDEARRMDLSGSSPTLTIGVAGSSLGQLKLTGNTSGTVTIQPDATASQLQIDKNLFINAATANLFLKDANTGFQVGSTTVINPLANNSIRSPTYTSGLNGWNINAAGDAEFNNVDVRGAIRSSVFIYNQLQATAGTFGVFKSACKLRTDAIVPAAPTYGTTTINIDCVDQDGVSHATSQLFTTGDVLRLKDGLAGDTWFTVASVSDQTTFWRYVATVRAGSNNVTYTTGAAVADYGASGAGFIIQTADQANSPYLQMATHSATFTSADASGSLITALKTRIGNLNGSYGYVAETYGAAFGDPAAANILIDPTNGIRIRHSTTDKIVLDASGNASFAGTITAASGTVGGFDIGADYIRDAANSMGFASTVTGGDDVRFWAGDTFANRATADFRVTEAGALFVTSADLTGGTLKTLVGGNTLFLIDDFGIKSGTYDYGSGLPIPMSTTPVIGQFFYTAVNSLTAASDNGTGAYGRIAGFNVGTSTNAGVIQMDVKPLAASGASSRGFIFLTSYSFDETLFGQLRVDSAHGATNMHVHAGGTSDLTSTIKDSLRLFHNTTGTAAAGYGAGLLFQLESSTTADQSAARIGTLWTDATHASRTSAVVIQTVNSGAALAEVARFTGSGASITGTTTNDSAAAGKVGELITGNLVEGSAVSLTTATAANVTSISLTAGDWDVSGVIAFKFAASTSYSNLISGTSTTSATFGAVGTDQRLFMAANVPGAASLMLSAPMTRYSLSATTTVYLVAYGTFTVSTLQAYGFIRARRVR